MAAPARLHQHQVELIQRQPVQSALFKVAQNFAVSGMGFMTGLPEIRDLSQLSLPTEVLLTPKVAGCFFLQPTGLTRSKHLPVWRAASVRSDPPDPADGLGLAPGEAGGGVRSRLFSGQSAARVQTVAQSVHCIHLSAT